MKTGGCVCGGVRYEIRGELGRSVFCHCSRCRKASGSVVAFNATVAVKDFVVVRGAELMKPYAAESGVTRVFCSNCGSQLISRREKVPDVVRLRLGTLDTPPERGPDAHIFVGSKISWFDLDDEAPRFEGLAPPEFFSGPK